MYEIYQHFSYFSSVIFKNVLFIFINKNYFLKFGHKSAGSNEFYNAVIVFIHDFI